MKISDCNPHTRKGIPFYELLKSLILSLVMSVTLVNAFKNKHSAEYQSFTRYYYILSLTTTVFNSAANK